MRLLMIFYLLSALVTLLALVRVFMLLVSTRSRALFARNPLGTLLLFALVGIAWLTPWGTPLGHIGAALDARHRLTLTYAPYPEVRNRFVFSRILKDRYGIFCPPVRGCFVISSQDGHFERSYNTAMRAVITRHYGRDIIAECAQATRDETGS